MAGSWSLVPQRHGCYQDVSLFFFFSSLCAGIILSHCASLAFTQHHIDPADSYGGHTSVSVRRGNESLTKSSCKISQAWFGTTGNCGGGDGMDNNKLAPTKLMSAGGDGVKGVDFPNGVYWETPTTLGSEMQKHGKGCCKKFVNNTVPIIRSGSVLVKWKQIWAAPYSNTIFKMCDLNSL
jgi:hypothetical protein